MRMDIVFQQLLSALCCENKRYRNSTSEMKPEKFGLCTQIVVNGFRCVYRKNKYGLAAIILPALFGGSHENSSKNFNIKKCFNLNKFCKHNTFGINLFEYPIPIQLK